MIFNKNVQLLNESKHQYILITLYSTLDRDPTKIGTTVQYIKVETIYAAAVQAAEMKHKMIDLSIMDIDQITNGNHSILHLDSYANPLDWYYIISPENPLYDSIKEVIYDPHPRWSYNKEIAILPSHISDKVPKNLDAVEFEKVFTAIVDKYKFNKDVSSKEDAIFNRDFLNEL